MLQTIEQGDLPSRARHELGFAEMFLFRAFLRTELGGPSSLLMLVLQYALSDTFSEALCQRLRTVRTHTEDEL